MAETATDLRNEFFHRRAYGQRSAERMGSLRAVAESDVFDVILDHYESFNQLLHPCAKASGRDSSVPNLDPNDVTSVEVRGGDIN
ncbi:hypothetical protein [Sinorhizobium prairiense]|uniref:hypothetical protein n=1 Tax=unclassified Sinorhizobium TaxID=2613772 RepID=UPI0023D814C9|nr:MULTISPECIES: hypothetical protein [unclassified Sinorhizobium]WEJ08592.1 hypothetical protein N0Q90_00140 [Sinorhizobium sp. M103]WEJ13905.1 hypothetical protein N0Q91_02525 [Sinorhizobium sp. K101]WEJ35505.1 hypothetical protein N0R80_02555 [Sinorhizobium sp. C101]